MTDVLVQQAQATEQPKATPAKKPTTKKPVPSKKPTPTSDVVTLATLCKELKIEPYDARVKLRAAVKDAKKYPALAKSHKAKGAWSWPKGDAAIKEARAILKD
jgi:hypothetical protein